MHVLSMRRLREFWESGHRKAEGPLREWHKKATKEEWHNLDDIRQVFASASEVKGQSGTSFVVFNIAGNWVSY